MPTLRLPLILAAAVLLGGCDRLGIESSEAVAARKEAEGKAVGAACRHAGRAIEDCYVLNRKADKAAVYAGWREMNDYMRENKIEPVAPQLSTQDVAAARPELPPRAAASEPAVEPAKKPAAKASPKKHDS